MHGYFFALKWSSEADITKILYLVTPAKYFTPRIIVKEPKYELEYSITWLHMQ